MIKKMTIKKLKEMIKERYEINSKDFEKTHESRFIGRCWEDKAILKIIDGKEKTENS